MIEGPGAAGRFAEMAARLDAPMYIVTTVGADGELSGCLIGYATPCSLEPPRFLAAISQLNRTHEVARSATALALHLVPTSEMRLAELFGGTTGDEVDKFGLCGWTAGPRGVPILDACPCWFVGEVAARVEVLGDHTGYVLDPIAASEADPGDHLTYGDVDEIQPGHPG